MVEGIIATAVAAAQDVPRVPANLLEQPPIIDGTLSEGEWDSAAKIADFIDPNTDQPAADLTEAWIGYDGKSIYVAFYAHARNPQDIIARSNQPGSGFDGEDSVIFGIDAFNRRTSNISLFSVNPLGTQTERISGGRSAKREWRGVWQAEATRVADGYIVEMAIPWEMLELPGGAAADIQINFAREQGKSQIISFFANRGLRDLGENDAIWEGVTLPASTGFTRFQPQVYLAPEFDEDRDPSFELRAGADLRYRFNRQLTGLLTVRPDFRNIEQQVEGIGFTRSERFLGDARPFFTEGGGFFRLTGPFGLGQLFYSRRINDFDVGGKFYGRLNEKDSVGILATLDEGDRIDAVAKVQRQLGTRDFVSAYGTLREGGSGREDALIGGSADFGRGFWGYGLDYAYLSNETSDARAGSPYVSYSIPGWFGIVRGIFNEPGFRPTLGLVPFDNRRGGYIYVEHEMDYRGGPLKEIRADLYMENFETYQDTNLNQQASLDARVTTWQDLEFGAGITTERFRDQPGLLGSLSFGWNANNPFTNAGIFYQFGERDHDDFSFINFGGRHRLPGNIDLSVMHSELDYRGTSQQSIFGLGWEINEEQSISARYVVEDGDGNVYLAYRKAGFEGLDYFFILGDPNARETRFRAALKVVWAG